MISDDLFHAWESRIHAFAAVCLSGDAGGPGHDTGDLNALAGVTVGVKDNIDVMGFPTRNGSRSCIDAEPATKDAAVVRSLRAAGARMIGKTTTTEFAFTDPTNCRNPYDLDRTPGGSSSGSGAAVAAGLVDVALGTQTAGSLCRPAAYCGAVAFKPTLGFLPTAGVTPLAPSFDTLGVMARSVSLARRSFQVMAPPGTVTGSRGSSERTALACLPEGEVVPGPSALDAFRSAGTALARLCSLYRAGRLEADAAGIVSDHRIVMNFEAARAHGHLLSDARAETLKPKFLAGLRAGAAISPADAADAAGRLAEARAAFWTRLAGVDFVLTLPVPDGAPALGETTGYQDWLTPWTVFGGPLVCLPWGLDSLGRPRSVMIAAHPGQDLALLDMAEALEAPAPELPPPTLPVR